VCLGITVVSATCEAGNQIVIWLSSKIQRLEGCWSETLIYSDTSKLIAISVSIHMSAIQLQSSYTIVFIMHLLFLDVPDTMKVIYTVSQKTGHAYYVS